MWLLLVCGPSEVAGEIRGGIFGGGFREIMHAFYFAFFAFLWLRMKRSNRFLSLECRLSMQLQM